MAQRENILDQVMAMFIAQGIRSVRMDDIARQLNVSKRTLYEMFGDKEELLYQCIIRFTCNRHLDRDKRLEKASNYLEMMLICLQEMVDHYPVGNRMRENLKRFYPKVYDKVVTEFEKKGVDGLREWIELCIEQGLILPEVNVDLSLAILYNTANGIFFRRDVWIAEGITSMDMLIYAMIMYIRGMATPAGIEIINDFCRRNFGSHYRLASL